MKKCLAVERVKQALCGTESKADQQAAPGSSFLQASHHLGVPVLLLVTPTPRPSFVKCMD